MSLRCLMVIIVLVRWTQMKSQWCSRHSWWLSLVFRLFETLIETSFLIFLLCIIPPPPCVWHWCSSSISARAAESNAEGCHPWRPVMGQGNSFFSCPILGQQTWDKVSFPSTIVWLQVKLREGAMILMMGTKDEDMPIQPVEKTKWVDFNVNICCFSIPWKCDLSVMYLKFWSFMGRREMKPYISGLWRTWTRMRSARQWRCLQACRTLEIRATWMQLFRWSHLSTWFFVVIAHLK